MLPSSKFGGLSFSFRYQGLTSIFAFTPDSVTWHFGSHGCLSSSVHISTIRMYCTYECEKMVLELHVLGPGFSLPSIDPQCLATISYLTLCVPRREWVLVANSLLALDRDSQLVEFYCDFVFINFVLSFIVWQTLLCFRRFSFYMLRSG